MADSNLYGLPTVQATLDSTSQFYAVTGTSGSFTDTRLPVAVLLNNTVLTGTPTVPGYLTSALAASTYLTSATAATTYLTQTNAASTYLTQANATSTYLTITTAASTYATITNLALKAPLASPNFSGTITAVAATFTGLITPSTTIGIKGTTLADAAQAGSIGEKIPGTATGVSLTTGIAANVTSISLTAGDWDVMGSIRFIGAGTTTIQSVFAGASSTTATFPASPLFAVDTRGSTQTGAVVSLTIPTQSFNVSTTTTIFLVAQAGFSVSTLTADANIWARRRR